MRSPNRAMGGAMNDHRTCWILAAAKAICECRRGGVEVRRPTPSAESIPETADNPTTTRGCGSSGTPSPSRPCCRRSFPAAVPPLAPVHPGLRQSGPAHSCSAISTRASGRLGAPGPAPRADGKAHRQRRGGGDEFGGDGLGRSVSISGDLAIVGAAGDDAFTGSAYAYDLPACLRPGIAGAAPTARSGPCNLPPRGAS